MQTDDLLEIYAESLYFVSAIDKESLPLQRYLTQAVIIDTVISMMPRGILWKTILAIFIFAQ